MNYREMATGLANVAGVSHEGAAIAFALLHLAEQVGRVADHLDQLTGDGPMSTSLRVVQR
jgi:hypothetical protein